LRSYICEQKRGVEIGVGRITDNKIRFIESLPDSWYAGRFSDNSAKGRKLRGIYPPDGNCWIVPDSCSRSGWNFEADDLAGATIQSLMKLQYSMKQCLDTFKDKIS